MQKSILPRCRKGNPRIHDGYGDFCPIVFPLYRLPFHVSFAAFNPFTGQPVTPIRPLTPAAGAPEGGTPVQTEALETEHPNDPDELIMPAAEEFPEEAETDHSKN